MLNDEKLITASELLSDCSMHRLVIFMLQEDCGGANFHSLQWMESIDGEWLVKCAYTQKTFSKSLGKDVWVNDIHAFDPLSGIATLRFATKGPDLDDGSTFILYSWREWNLMDDCEYRFIEICEDIFGPPINKFKEYCIEQRDKHDKELGRITPKC